MMARLRSLFVALALLIPAQQASAAPVILKLSFFTSDRSNIYECQVKPFVEAVNRDGSGLVEIKIYSSGAISPDLGSQSKLVRDGTADLAILVPGTTPDEFPDSAALELPGVFKDEIESSRVFTRLVEAGALRGYQPFFVVGAFVSAGESIHSRKPLASLAELKGQTIRVNNPIESSILKRLGALPLRLPINRTMDGLSQGTLDGVTVPPSMLFEFGFGRLTENHYLIGFGGAPVTLLMNRDKFASLPPRAQEIVRKYSGEWLAAQEAACFESKNRDIAAQLMAAPRRKVVVPSEADAAILREVYAAVVENWAAESPHNRDLLTLLMSEIAKLRKETPR